MGTGISGAWGDATSGFFVVSGVGAGCGAVMKLLSDKVISRSGAVVELFWSIFKDAGSIAPTMCSGSIFSGLLNSAASGCGEVGAAAIAVSAAISVLIGFAIGSGEFWANSAGGRVDWSGGTAKKFDGLQIIARHT